MITQEYLNECFVYDPFAGLLTWKERPRDHFKSHRSWRMANGKYSGRQAGCVHRCSGGHRYIRLGIDGNNIMSHRIIWYMQHGEWPDKIDHINGNGLDNRLENIRCVDASGNMKNTITPRRNTSGVMGVYWFKARQKWGVIIASNGDREFLGLYSDWFDAVCARKSAELRLGFHKNHGRAA